MSDALNRPGSPGARPSAHPPLRLGQGDGRARPRPPSNCAAILAAGARVPDHGKLLPWRFIVFEGEARERMGDILAEVTQPRRRTHERIEEERSRFLRAPVVIAVVSRAREQIKIPVWEQNLSAGAVCQNILIAAHAHGVRRQLDDRMVRL